MAVDIKQLRIGAHVLLSRENKRVRVEGITKRKIGYHMRADKTDHLAYARLNEIEPIPITSELLVELGFNCTCMDEDGEEAIKDRICLRQFRGMDCWSLLIDIDDPIGFLVRYLHEVENFTYLTLGKELIEE